LKKTYLLCPYDGFKFRIYSEKYVKYIEANREKYRLTKKEKLYKHDDPDYGKLTKIASRTDDKPHGLDETYEQLDGAFNGFTIKTRKHKRLGYYAQIEGSFHKYFYNGQNYQPFYWKDFLSVYAEFIEMFGLEPFDVRVVNLEVGINVKTLVYWDVTARKICRRILFFNPPRLTRGMNEKQYKYNGMGWISEHDNYWLKVYDKIPKYGVKKVEDLLRLEKRYIKSGPLKKLGVVSLSDLLKQEVVESLIADLFKTLDKLVIKQPEIIEAAGLSNYDNKFLLDYYCPENWDEGYQRNPKAFTSKIKNRYRKLISDHCSIDLKKEILNEAKFLLEQKQP
jgi:hypothetical protein